METGDLAWAVARAADAVGVRYYITGSVASSVWGLPRNTYDVDAVVDLTPDTVEAFCGQFGSDYFVDVDAARDAVRTRQMFCIIAPDWGLKIDVIVPEDRAKEAVRLGRARPEVVLGTDKVARLSSPEDSILSKMDFFRIGGSRKHIRDIEGILANPALTLDRGYIDVEAARSGLSEVWEDLKAGRRPRHEHD